MGCRQKRAQSELLRIAARGESTPCVDIDGKLPGRGAYVCRDWSCAERALNRRAFERALKLKSTPPPCFRSELEAATKKI